MNTLKLNLLKIFSKEELSSMAKTFIAIFLPSFIIILQNIDTNNLTIVTLSALIPALLRALVKAVWDTLAQVLAK